MIFRPLGATQWRVSTVGLGGEFLDGKPYEQVHAVIDEALKYGINILDVFMPGGAVRANIGKALKGRREQMIIQGHVGSCEKNGQYDITRDLDQCKRSFESLLRCLDTDYIDLGMLFFIDSDKDFQGVFDTDFIKYVQQLKDHGVIRAIGFSSHNPRTATRVIETGVVQSMLFSVNLAFDMTPAHADVLDELEKGLNSSAYAGIDPDRAALYTLCERKGVGITVMKALGAGKLISKEHAPFHRPMTVGQCIHYALSRPAVSSVLIGCATPQEVREAVGYFGQTDAEKDYSDILASFKGGYAGQCVYCSHCEPCPSEIGIAAVNKYLDIAKLDTDHIPESVRSHYRALAHTASECIGCGNCETRCPFGVKIIKNMEIAQKLFGV